MILFVTVVYAVNAFLGSCLNYRSLSFSNAVFFVVYSAEFSNETIEICMLLSSLPDFILDLYTLVFSCEKHFLMNRDSHLAFKVSVSVCEYFSEMGESYEQLRSDRIRAAMFPMYANIMNGTATGTVHRSSIVEKLTEPSQLLTTAVVELLSLQDESELTTKAIPELVKLLADTDEVFTFSDAFQENFVSSCPRCLHFKRLSANQ